MKKMNLKKLSAIMITTAILLQNQMVFASDLFSDGTSVDIFSAPVEFVVEQPVQQAPVQEAPLQPIIEEEPVQEIIIEEPVQEVIVEIEAVEDVFVEEVQPVVEEEPVQEITVDEVETVVDEMVVESVEESTTVPEEVFEAEENMADDISMEIFEGEPVEDFRNDFRYEDETAIITANALEAAQLPMSTEMIVVRLAEGTPEFEEAKAASVAVLGAADNMEYVFYDVTFVVDGQEIEPAEGTVALAIEFKTVQIDENAEMQNVLHIEDTENGKVVNDVTATTGTGSNMQSVDIAF